MTSTLAIVATVRRADGRRRQVPASVKTKRAPPVGHVLDPDVLAVGLDEGLGDGQAEPGPAPGVEAHEPVEDGLPLGGGDAGPCVGHRHGHPVAADLGGHRDHGSPAAHGGRHCPRG